MTDEAGFTKLIFSALGLSGLAAISRTILSEDRRTLLGFGRGLVLAGFAGILALLIMQDFSYSETTQGAIVGVVAFCADDLLMLLVKIGKALSEEDPKEWIKWAKKRFLKK